MLTLEELKERLAENYDEVTLLELLRADAHAVVEAFSDKIEEEYDYFLALVIADEETDE